MNITPEYSPTSDGSGRTILSKAKARLVASAYLNARMPKKNPEKAVFLRIDPFITPMLLKVDPSLQPHASPGGTIMVEFNRALYGCIVSAKFWFEKLTDTLKNMGFLPNDCDPCFLTRCRNGVLTTVIM